MKRIVPLALLAALAACHDSTGPETKIATLVVVPSPLYLSLGDTARLFAHGTAAVAGAYVAVSARYTALDPSVASVTQDGLATGVAIGTGRIVASAAGHADTVTVNVVGLPSVRTFNVSTNGDPCTGTDYHAARVAATSAHAVIYEDLANPAGGFTPAEYQAIADEFERVAWATDTRNFGTPTDLDGNGKVDILYTRAVNELTPANAGYIVGGFFDPRDVFPRAGNSEFNACPASNYDEMFYILVPDSAGSINGNQRTKAFVRQTTVSTLAHELEHLINASRRFYVNHADSAEVVWLDEGLAHVAEELAFQTASGVGPRQNIDRATLASSAATQDAFDTFGRDNFGRLGLYLENPAPHSPWAHDGQLETRGATWSLLRYLADRRGGDEQAFWYSLVNSKTWGMANLQAALGTDPVLAGRDWSVANYSDDRGVPVAAAYTQPSWNFRDVFSAAPYNGYPLTTDVLGSRPANVTIKSGSAEYLRFGVPAGGLGEIRFSQGSATVAGDCTTLIIAPGEVQQFTVGSGLALCFPPAAGTTAQYAVIPYYANPASDALYSLRLAGVGLVSPAFDAAPARLPRFSSSVTGSNAGVGDGGWEIAFRERTWQALTPRVARFRRAIRTATAPAPSPVYVNVFRIR